MNFPIWTLWEYRENFVFSRKQTGSLIWCKANPQRIMVKENWLTPSRRSFKNLFHCLTREINKKIWINYTIVNRTHGNYSKQLITYTLRTVIYLSTFVSRCYACTVFYLWSSWSCRPFLWTKIQPCLRREKKRKIDSLTTRNLISISAASYMEVINVFTPVTIRGTH